jgi:hypothetical protein
MLIDAQKAILTVPGHRCRGTGGVRLGERCPESSMGEIVAHCQSTLSVTTGIDRGAGDDDVWPWTVGSAGGRASDHKDCRLLMMRR